MREAEENHPSFLKLGKERDKDKVNEIWDEIEARQGEIDELGDQKLMEAYNLLKTEGEETFRQRHNLRPGWVDDGEGGLRYSSKVAYSIERQGEGEK